MLKILTWLLGHKVHCIFEKRIIPLKEVNPEKRDPIHRVHAKGVDEEAQLLSDKESTGKTLFASSNPVQNDRHENKSYNLARPVSQEKVVPQSISIQKVEEQK